MASQRSILQHSAHNCLRQKQVLMQRTATDHNIGSPWISCRGISSLWQIYSHSCCEHQVHTLCKVQNNCRLFGCQFKRWFYYACCNIAVLIQAGLFGAMKDSKVNILLSMQWHIPQQLAQHFKECCSHRLENNPNSQRHQYTVTQVPFFLVKEVKQKQASTRVNSLRNQLRSQKNTVTYLFEGNRQLQCLAAII